MLGVPGNLQGHFKKQFVHVESVSERVLRGGETEKPPFADVNRDDCGFCVDDECARILFTMPADAAFTLWFVIPYLNMRARFHVITSWIMMHAVLQMETGAETFFV